MPRAALFLLLLLAGCQMPVIGRERVVLPPPAPPASSAAELAALERETIDVVNRVRASSGAGALAANDAMVRAAREHAQELARRGVLDHASPTPGRETFAKRLAAAGAPAWTLAGENLIQLPYVAADVADEAVTGWLGSPSHRAQMIEPTYTDTGVGIARNASGNWYIVQLFIRRR